MTKNLTSDMFPTLCDDSSGSFQPSTILKANPPQRFDFLPCMSGFGEYFNAKEIRVQFKYSFDSSALTERRVKVVLGSDCTGNISSKPLRVIGKWTHNTVKNGVFQYTPKVCYSKCIHLSIFIATCPFMDVLHHSISI